MKSVEGMYPASKNADGIWNHLYRVNIPYVFSRSQEDFDQRGTYVTGVNEVDEMVKTSKVLVQIPLIKIIELYNEGSSVTFSQKEDITRAYKTLTDYMSEWDEKYSGTIHSLPPEISDMLQTFKRFSKDLEAMIDSPDLGIEIKKKRQSIGIGRLLESTGTSSRQTQSEIEVNRHNYDSIGNLVKRNRRY